MAGTRAGPAGAAEGVVLLAELQGCRQFCGPVRKGSPEAAAHTEESRVRGWPGASESVRVVLALLDLLVVQTSHCQPCCEDTSVRLPAIAGGQAVPTGPQPGAFRLAAGS